MIIANEGYITQVNELIKQLINYKQLYFIINKALPFLFM